MSEEWRDSEAQVIMRGRWTRLNGTHTEILIPHQGGATGGGSAPGDLVIRVRRSRSSG